MRSSFPNHCDDAPRALNAAGAEADRLAEHLASCPRCAALAERDAALDRLWESTRPLEPSAEVWSSVWARVADRLDRRAATAAPTPTLRRWGRHGATLFIVAQAAAILAAVVLWSPHRRPSSEAPTPGPAPGRMAQTQVPRVGVEIEPGESVLIRVEGKGLRTITLARDDRGNTLDEMYVWFNDVEAMAGTIHNAHAATPPG